MTGYRVQSDGIPVIDKSPGAVLDYPFDFNAEDPGPWLQSGETIASSIVTVDDGLTHVTDAISPVGAGKRVIVWLAEGMIGETYLVTVHIVTSQGREDERSIRVRVVAR